jgi:hypothetical protein
MTRTLALLSALLVAGCRSIAGPTTDSLSFADMQSLNPGVSGSWILAEHPYARDVDRGPDGRIRRLTYWVTDPNGKPRGLVLRFDANEVLVEKQYGGPIVRPPDSRAGK